jgi:hypothetical protein
VILAGERIFCSLLPGYIKLFSGELTPPLSISFYNRGYILCLTGAGVENGNHATRFPWLVLFHQHTQARIVQRRYIDLMLRAR